MYQLECVSTWAACGRAHPKPLRTTLSTLAMPPPHVGWVTGSKFAGPTRTPPHPRTVGGSRVRVNLQPLDPSTLQKSCQGGVKGVGSHSDPVLAPPRVTGVTKLFTYTQPQHWSIHTYTHSIGAYIHTYTRSIGAYIHTPIALERTYIHTPTALEHTYKIGRAHV